MVSTDGQIKSVRYDRILKPFTIGKYLGVWLGAGNKHYIHHIVAKVFCPKIDIEGLEIDHINRNRYDNRAENLRWVNRTTNQSNRNEESQARVTNKLNERYIHQDKYNHYILNIKSKYYGYYKTLEEAKKRREEIYDAIRNN